MNKILAALLFFFFALNASSNDSSKEPYNKASDCTVGALINEEEYSVINRSNVISKNIEEKIRKERNEDINNGSTRYMLLIAFDGTGNHQMTYSNQFDKEPCINDSHIINKVEKRNEKYIGTSPNGPNSVQSNVSLIFNIFNSTKSNSFNEYSNFDGIYISGVGTTPTYNLAPGYYTEELNHTEIEFLKNKPFLLGNAFQKYSGAQMKFNSDAAIIMVESILRNNFRKNNWRFDKGEKLDIVIIGFSRGSGSALIFSNKIKKHKFQISENKYLDFNKDFLLHTAVLFDTVVSYNIDGNSKSLTVPSEFKNFIHITANNEYRAEFPLLKTEGGNVIELNYPGAHADIGGGYHYGGISGYTFKVASDILKAIGIPMIYQENFLNGSFENSFIHDSIQGSSKKNEVSNDFIECRRKGVRKFQYAKDPENFSLRKINSYEYCKFYTSPWNINF